MATLQEQARALGDPTRHRIFDHVVTSVGPVDVAELTELLGLNHNAIRQHLAKLVDAGLLVEAKATSTGPGRPRLVYTVDPTTESRWGATGPYERLSMLLTEIIRSGDSAVEVGRRAGRGDRRDRVGHLDIDTAIDELRRAMEREGFEPEVREGRTGTDIILHNCPFESTASLDPDTVCALHLGMAEGIAEDADGVEVDELISKDPRRAGCRLELRLERPRD